MNNYVFKESEEALNHAQQRKVLSERVLSVKEYTSIFIDPKGEYNAVVLPTDSRYNKLEKDSEGTEEIDTAIYLGYMLPIWGHVLTDSFKKLWFLQTPDCQKLIERGAKLVYVTRAAKTLISAYQDIWDLADVNYSDFIHIDIATRVKKIYVPEDCFNWGIDAEKVNYTKEFLPFVENISKKFSAGGQYEISKNFPVWPEKVYFTRLGFHDVMKRDQGEKALVKIYEKLGYSIIYPERLSVVDQIGLVSHCNSFVTTEGSISHISLYCKPKTDVVILRKCRWVNGYQIAINEIADLNVTYIDAHQSDNVNTEAPYFGPFYMCVNANIEHALHIHFFYLPYWMKISWWWYMNKNRKIVKKILRR